MPETTAPAVELPGELRRRLAEVLPTSSLAGYSKDDLLVRLERIVADAARRAYAQGYQAGSTDAAGTIAEELKARGRAFREMANTVFEMPGGVTTAARAYAEDLDRRGQPWLDAAELAEKCQLPDSSAEPTSAVCGMTSDTPSAES